MTLLQMLNLINKCKVCIQDGSMSQKEKKKAVSSFFLLSLFINVKLEENIEAGGKIVASA